MGASICSTLVELGELGRLSASMKMLEKNLKNSDKYKYEENRATLQKSNKRTLALAKAGMDVVVAVGLLQLAPKKVTPRVTGAFGLLRLSFPVISYFYHHPKARHTEVGSLFCSTSLLSII